MPSTTGLAVALFTTLAVAGPRSYGANSWYHQGEGCTATSAVAVTKYAASTAPVVPSATGTAYSPTGYLPTGYSVTSSTEEAEATSSTVSSTSTTSKSKSSKKSTTTKSKSSKESTTNTSASSEATYPATAVSSSTIARTTSSNVKVAGDASFPIPESQGSVTYDAAEPISGTFDGGYKTYGRGISCTDGEGDDSDAVFILEDGATLKNAIIGADQREGVHCKGSCTIENVWWSAVCEDALSLKGDGNADVIGGGATGATDKVVQHNGAGTVTITDFTVKDFGKLYRSCGNCKGNGAARNVVISNVKATNGKWLVGINSNYGDTATITNTCATEVKTICAEYEGTNDNDVEPKMISDGPSDACRYETLPTC